MLMICSYLINSHAGSEVNELVREHSAQVLALITLTRWRLCSHTNLLFVSLVVLITCYLRGTLVILFVENIKCYITLGRSDTYRDKTSLK